VGVSKDRRRIDEARHVVSRYWGRGGGGEKIEGQRKGEAGYLLLIGVNRSALPTLHSHSFFSPCHLPSVGWTRYRVADRFSFEKSKLIYMFSRPICPTPTKPFWPVNEWDIYRTGSGLRRSIAVHEEGRLESCEERRKKKGGEMSWDLQLTVVCHCQRARQYHSSPYNSEKETTYSGVISRLNPHE